MKTETATQAKIHFGRVLADSMLEPILIEKSGRNVAVLISYDEYQRMSSLEDQYWISKAAEAKNEGLIGVKASEKLLQDLLNVQN
ncbi:MAG: type II toxin-antitoxin system prevent-host-death family antitoxin [Gammaproteobacteria bacterium]|nr:type II toxin-antitoxin system prevent-host-death family antitoxin [Gammaproteobacteria bacterium]